MKKYGYNYEKIFNNVYRIYENPAINLYLILGSKKGLLVDTGCGYANLRALIDELCPNGYYVVNTHAHCDHIAANYQFDDIYISSKEMPDMINFFLKPEEKELHYKMMNQYHWTFMDENYKQLFHNSKPNFKTHPIYDGDQFDLGDITIEAIEVPGHTIGGMAFLEIENKRLYNGDMIIRHAALIHKNGTNLQTFIKGMNKLWQHHERFDLTIAAHGHRKGFEPLPKEMINKLIQCANEIDVSKSVPIEEFDGSGLEYKMTGEDISLAYRLDQLNR